MTTDSTQPPAKLKLTASKGSKKASSCCSDHVKRPMNPFMVWAQSRRKAIAAANPKMHNAEISRCLGEEWRSLSDEDKRLYREKAHKIKAEHTAAHPDYKYKPKCKKRPASRENSSVEQDSLDDQQLQAAKADASDQAALEQQQQHLSPPPLQGPNGDNQVVQIIEQPPQAEEQQPQCQYLYQLQTNYGQVVYVDQQQLSYLLQQQQQQQQLFQLQQQQQQYQQQLQAQQQMYSQMTPEELLRSQLYCGDQLQQQQQPQQQMASDESSGYYSSYYQGHVDYSSLAAGQGAVTNFHGAGATQSAILPPPPDGALLLSQL